MFVVALGNSAIYIDTSKIPPSGYDWNGYHWSADFFNFNDGNGTDLTLVGPYDQNYTLENMKRYQLTSLDDVSLVKYDVNYTVNGGTFTVFIDSGSDVNLQFNLSGVEYLLDTNTLSVDATAFAGVDGQPNTIYVYAEKSGSSIVLTASNTDPELAGIEHVAIAHIIAGTVSSNNVTLYGSFATDLHPYEFVKDVFYRFYYEGAVYIDGMNPDANTLDVNITAGNMRIIFDNLSTTYESVNVDGMFWIDYNGDFVFSKSFDDIDKYSTGETISNNKYFNVVLGIVPADPELSDFRILALIQEGSKEYTSLNSAIQDTYDQTVYAPSDSTLKAVYIPIARLIVLKTGAGSTLQQFPNGKYYKDIRNLAAGGGAGTSVTVVSPWFDTGTSVYTPGTRDVNVSGNLYCSADINFHDATATNNIYADNNIISKKGSFVDLNAGSGNIYENTTKFDIDADLNHACDNDACTSNQFKVNVTNAQVTCDNNNECTFIGSLDIGLGETVTIVASDVNITIAKIDDLNVTNKLQVDNNTVICWTSTCDKNTYYDSGLGVVITNG